jgi:hypothetical protein
LGLLVINASLRAFKIAFAQRAIGILFAEWSPTSSRAGARPEKLRFSAD